MKTTTVTIVRTYDDVTEDVWIDVVCEDGRNADVVEALGIIELGKVLLVEAG